MTTVTHCPVGKTLFVRGGNRFVLIMRSPLNLVEIQNNFLKTKTCYKPDAVTPHKWRPSSSSAGDET
jgi:hypothetical protein